MLSVWIFAFLLILLGIVDLVVGVTNDAVNFLHAALGSRVSSRKIIFWISSIGILIGSIFSGGMMEVAQNGVIYPQSYNFEEIMVLFLAVMITDLFLIDGFNTLGFPTSTTIAIVFELLGGGLALALLKTHYSPIQENEINGYINSEKAFLIFAGILVSIFLAFILGTVIQFISRLIFSFKYKSRYRILSSLMGGISLTAILFLLLKKGISGASFMTPEIVNFIATYLFEILLTIFTGATVILLFISYSFDIDVFKVVVFIGTFTLALSFAANDLVNFIGVPLAGIEACQAYFYTGIKEPAGYVMSVWADGVTIKESVNVVTYTILLLISGVIMSIALFYSKKVRTVTETEMYLGRHGKGYEQFEPSSFSRMIVSNFLMVYDHIEKRIPNRIKNILEKRFERKEDDILSKNDEVVFFDTLRASINLVVASILISLGTYFKLPLSTTIVVFMVAMGTSLSDKAWGREVAIYRISGVISILGGWFVTACLAFLFSFLLSLLISWGGITITTLLVILLVYFLVQSRRFHRKREHEKHESEIKLKDEVLKNIENLKINGSEEVRRKLLETSKVFYLFLDSVVDENIEELNVIYLKAKSLREETRRSKIELFSSFDKMEDDAVVISHFLIQTFDYLTELINTVYLLVKPAIEHFETNKQGLTQEQKEDLRLVIEEVMSYLNQIVHVEKGRSYLSVPEMVVKQKYLMKLLEDLRKKQIRRIKENSFNNKSKVSILYLDILAETKNMILYAGNLLKAHRDFHEGLYRNDFSNRINQNI